MPELHVLFVVDNYPPKVGGVEQHVHALARTLARRAGVRVSVFTLSDAESEALEDGVTVVRLRGFGDIGGVISCPRPGTLRRLRTYARAQRVDVVSTHTRFFPMTVLGTRLASSLGIVHVHTEHGAAHVSGVGPLVGLASRAVDLTLGRWVIRSADKVLGVSDNACAFVGDLAGVEAETFMNGIDTDAWVSARTHAATRRLAFVGRLVPGKGWETFLDVVARLLGDGLAVQADVYGDGPDRGRAEALARGRGLQEVVRFRGAVAQRVLAEELGCAVLVNPSTLAEGFQTTVLEAVAAGGAVASYPVPSADALARAGAPVRIAQRDRPEELGRLARELLEEEPRPWPPEALHAWDWSARADRFLEVIEEPVTR